MKEALLSTAYMPPTEYMAVASQVKKVYIESNENYHKQTYRNRTIITGANGIITLVVPVLRGSFHKTHIRDTKIDYSQRWINIHISSLRSAYASSPYYEFYYEELFKSLGKKDKYLIDLNMNLLNVICKLSALNVTPSFTDSFTPVQNNNYDRRYSITPKNTQLTNNSACKHPPYYQVFMDKYGFVPNLSILDLLFNVGPETEHYLRTMSI